tara:strand:- start:1177 stop:2463 length:1287 start_codon:yes stop_codon:yes gene_type:complete
MSAAAFAKVLEHVDEDDLTRNERLLNLRELDCEIKERELKLAEHLRDLEMREAAVTQRKRDIAAELQYELGLELEKVRAHEEEVLREKEQLAAEVTKREQALTRREILVQEREWTLKAKEDAPKGVMGTVFENLEALGTENDKNCQTNRTHLDNTSTSAMPLFVENALFVGTVDEEVAWLEARIKDMKERILIIAPPPPVRAPRPPKLRPKRHAETDPDLRALADQAEDLREHLSAARLKNDLKSIMAKVDEAVADVNEMHARGKQEDARVAAKNAAEKEYVASARRMEQKQESEHWERMAYGNDTSWRSEPSQSSEKAPVVLGAQHELFPPESSKSVGSGPGDETTYVTPETPAEIAQRIAQETQLMTAKVKAFQAKMEGRLSPGPVSPEHAKGSRDIRGFFEKSPRKGTGEGEEMQVDQAPATACE